MTVPAVRLEMQRIHKRFGGTLALAGIDIGIRSGEVHAIVGENGAGKSTLMRILSGAITDYDGQLILNGKPVRFTGPRDAENHGISIIYQELNLVPALSAAANIFLGRESRRGLFVRDRQMEREATDYFRQLGAHVDPKMPVKRLRIGDQQLVEIAKALSLDSDILIMDEPTSALADAEVQRLIGIIGSLKDHGVTILYISHKMDEVFRVADRISILRDGHLVATVDTKKTTPGEVVRCMVGRDIAKLDFAHDATEQKELLRVENLSLPHRERPGAWHLCDINLVVQTGELVGVAGLLGAGRTELIECLFGANSRRPTGTIRIQGEACILNTPKDAIARGMAMVSEDRKRFGLFPSLNLCDNITICQLNELTRRGLISRSHRNAAAREQMDRLAIRAAGPQSPISSASGGNQQKCVLARWLLTRPIMLLLDEPTRGIDMGAKAELYVLLRRLCHDGIGILMTSSELPELLAVCDRIVVLCNGRIAGMFDRSEATEEKLVRAAMGLSETPQAAGTVE